MSKPTRNDANILIVVVRENMHACSHNLKLSNIDIYQDYLSKKEKIELLSEVCFF